MDPYKKALVYSIDRHPCNTAFLQACHVVFALSRPVPFTASWRVGIAGSRSSAAITPRKLFLAQSGYRACDPGANSSATKMAGRTAREEERYQRESATASQSGKYQAIGPPALPPKVAFIGQELMPDLSFCSLPPPVGFLFDSAERIF